MDLVLDAASKSRGMENAASEPECYLPWVSIRAVTCLAGYNSRGFGQENIYLHPV